VHDPAGRIVYSAHLYFDADHSGQYRKPYAQDGATPEIGAHRLAPFVGWLRLHHLRGQIGEMGVPYDDPAWLPVLDRFLDAARRSCDVLEGSAYWMAGDWADRYALTLQPAADGRWADRPQMKVLMRPRP
jgi:endoglucanase